MENKNIDLFGQFVRLEWLLHRYHQQNHRFHGPMGDPRRGQGRVLALLKLKPEMSQKELSNILDIRSQSLGELLSKLERSGYITRTPSEADRRIMEIRLTEEGKQAAEQSEQQTEFPELFGCLKEEEQAALSDYLSRIITQLEQQYSENDPDGDYRDRPPYGDRGFGRFHPTEDGRPPFDGRDFGGHPPTEGGHPAYDGRGFGGQPPMGRGRPPFGRRGFGPVTDEENEPDGSGK